jgi:hypothetical protein
VQFRSSPPYLDCIHLEIENKMLAARDEGNEHLENQLCDALEALWHHLAQEDKEYFIECCIKRKQTYEQ